MRSSASSGSSHRWVARRFSVLYLGVGSVVAWLLGRNLAPTLRFEDAMIVLRYARNIVDGSGFVFNQGERVLGVTTPLHTLVSAAFVGIARDSAPILQNCAGIVFLVLQSWMAAVITRQVAGIAAGVFAGALVLANLNLSLLYVGMEVHLFSFLVLLVHWLFLRSREVPLGLALGVAFLTRYDAALLAACVGFGRLVEKRRFPTRLTAIFFLVVAPWLVFAQLYFGSIVPNTLAAKRGFVGFVGYLHHTSVYYKRTLESLVGVYADSASVRDHVAWFLPLIIVLGGVAMILRDRRHIALFGFPAVLAISYAIIGSDPAFTWHHYPINAVIFISLAVGCSRLADMLLGLAEAKVDRRHLLVSGLIVLLAVPVAFRVAAVARHQHLPGRHTQDLYAIADWLDRRYGSETSLLHPSIGIIGYETELRIIDQAGLVTEGLRYLDGTRFTPTEEILNRYDPHLVLALKGAHTELANHGYEVLWQYSGHYDYHLWERSSLPRE